MQPPVASAQTPPPIPPDPVAESLRRNQKSALDARPRLRPEKRGNISGLSTTGAAVTDA
jgi:hypothetical protein